MVQNGRTTAFPLGLGSYVDGALDRAVAMSREEPGALESVIPIWGSGRGLVADLQQGDYAGAGMNGAMLAMDLLGGGLVADGLVQGAKLMRGSSKWRAVRGRMTKQGLAEKGQHVHHALFEQNRGLGQLDPENIKHHPLNTKAMSSPEVHGRIHHAYTVNGVTKAQYDVLRRTWIGSPEWAQHLGISQAGRPAEWLHDNLEQRRGQR